MAQSSGSPINVGSQVIGWKYSTPLKANYLNTIISGLTSPGLIVRPEFKVIDDNSISVSPFSCYVQDENDPFFGKFCSRLIKITVEETTVLPIPNDDSACAIGLSYSLVSEKEWYANFKPIGGGDEAKTFKGIIIATIVSVTDPQTGKKYRGVSTQGADISDALLREEGFDPYCWVSLISPRRISGKAYDRLEVRCHNQQYSGYMNGTKGFRKWGTSSETRLEYLFPKGDTDPSGVRASDLPADNCLFNYTSSGFNLCDYFSGVSVGKTSGGVIAYVDAKVCRQNTWSGSFSNALKIYPCKQEDVNVFIDGEILYIK